MSQLEDRLAWQIQAKDLPPPEREFRFHPSRRWRLDFAWPQLGIAIEVQGGTWNQGRHSRPRGYENDCEKLNAAQTAGWCVLQATSDMVKDGRAIRAIEDAMEMQTKSDLDVLQALGIVEVEQTEPDEDGVVDVEVKVKTH